MESIQESIPESGVSRNRGILDQLVSSSHHHLDCDPTDTGLFSELLEILLESGFYVDVSIKCEFDGNGSI